MVKELSMAKTHNSSGGHRRRIIFEDPEAPTPTVEQRQRVNLGRMITAYIL